MKRWIKQIVDPPKGRTFTKPPETVRITADELAEALERRSAQFWRDRIAVWTGVVRSVLDELSPDEVHELRDSVWRRVGTAVFGNNIPDEVRQQIQWRHQGF